jgi:hypothetical protein
VRGVGLKMGYHIVEQMERGTGCRAGQMRTDSRDDGCKHDATKRLRERAAVHPRSKRVARVHSAEMGGGGREKVEGVFLNS